MVRFSTSSGVSGNLGVTAASLGAGTGPPVGRPGAASGTGS